MTTSPMTTSLFPGFTPHRVPTPDGHHIHTLVGGTGPALLLLHGHPQTSAIWHKLAPVLAQHFTLVLADLRGYGDSAKPAGDAEHLLYSKRTMAADMLAVMAHLGHPRFAVLAHDRGARVAHRLAADQPEAVSRMVLLDIAPTLAMYEQTSNAFARAYWHWFFLIQPAPLPRAPDRGRPGCLCARRDGPARCRPGPVRPACPGRVRALPGPAGHGPRHLRGLPRRRWY